MIPNDISYRIILLKPSIYLSKPWRFDYKKSPSPIYRRAAPPPPFRSGCSVSRGQECPLWWCLQAPPLRSLLTNTTLKIILVTTDLNVREIRRLRFFKLFLKTSTYSQEQGLVADDKQESLGSNIDSC
ncbi:hypothetical protein Bca4012_092684 [Brassica carinata]